MSSRHFLAVCLVLSLPASLYAQQNLTNQQQQQLRRQQQQLRQQQQGQQQMQQNASQPLSVQGKIQGMAKGNIFIVGDNNRVWKVGVVNGVTRILVAGTTTPNALRSGFIVEFTAEIDTQGVVQKPVETLKIISLIKEKPLGIYPTATQGDNAGGFGASGDSETSGKHKRSSRTSDKAASRAPATGTVHVVGKLIVGRDGTLSAQIPNRGIMVFKLADQAKVEVEQNEFALANRGYDITANCLVSRQSNTIQAVEVRIKLPELPVAEKATTPTTSETKKSETKKPGKYSKKSKVKDDADLPVDAPVDQ